LRFANQNVELEAKRNENAARFIVNSWKLWKLRLKEKKNKKKPAAKPQ